MRDDYAVAVNDIVARGTEVEVIVEELAKSGRTIAILGDVSQEKDIEDMISRTVEELGELKVVVSLLGRWREEAESLTH